MRAILILIVIAVVLSLLGWVTFQATGNRASVTIDKDKINADTHGVIEKGGEAVEEIGESIKDATDRDDDVPIEPAPVPAN